MTVRFLDTETWPIARGRLAPPIVCVQDGTAPDDARIQRWDDDARHAAFGWLSSDELIVGANIAYEMAVFAADSPVLGELAWRAYDVGRVRDIQIDYKLLDFAKGLFTAEYSLGALAEREQLPNVKGSEWRLRFHELAGVHADDYPAEAREYALGDVVLPAIMWPRLQAQAAKLERALGTKVLHVSAEKARSAWFLHLQSCWGVHADPTRTAQFRGQVEAYIAKLRTRLQKTYITVRVPNEKKWGKYLTTKKEGIAVAADGRARVPFVRAGGELVKIAQTSYMRRLVRRGRLRGQLPLTDKGGVCCDRDTCEQAHSFLLEAVCDYGSQRNLLGRVRDLEQGFEYPLQTRYNPMLKTGRTSSSRPQSKKKAHEIVLVGTQLQNNPRNGMSRECYAPPEGEVFFDADYPSAELHALAQVQMTWFKRSKLADLLLGGTDVLLWFGATVLNGIPYEEALRSKKAGDKAVKDMRQGAKAAIYGYPGGLGVAGMVGYARRNYGQIVTERTTKKWYDAWMQALQMGPYFDRIRSHFRQGAEQATLIHPVSGLVRGGAYYTEMSNSCFQSLTAFGACDAGYHVSRECYRPVTWDQGRGVWLPEPSPLYGTRPWGFIHDQILASGSEESAPAAADRLAELMTVRYNVWTPDVPIAKGKTEGTVFRVWRKSNEAVRGPNGKLIPCEDASAR